MWSRADPRRHNKALLEQLYRQTQSLLRCEAAKAGACLALVVRCEFFNLPKGPIFSIWRTR
jgi:hypothetical protein